MRWRGHRSLPRSRRRSPLRRPRRIDDDDDESDSESTRPRPILRRWPRMGLPTDTRRSDSDSDSSDSCSVDFLTSRRRAGRTGASSSESQSSISRCCAFSFPSDSLSDRLLVRSTRLAGSRGVGGSGESGPSDAESSRNALRRPLPSLIARIRSNAPSCVLSLRTASVPRAIYVLSYPSPPRREMRSPEVIREASRRIQRREWSIHACESSGSLLDDARGTFDARHARSVVGAGAECYAFFSHERNILTT